MDPVTLGFGIACAAVIMVAVLLSRAWQDTLAAMALIVMYTVTKVFTYRSDSVPGIALDAAMPVIGALTACIIIYASPRLYWPRVLVSAMLVTSVEVFAFAWAIHNGFEYPKNTHRASPGVRNGAGLVRSWMSLHHHGRPWSRAGVKWGREADTAPHRKAKAR